MDEDNIGTVMKTVKSVHAGTVGTRVAQFASAKLSADLSEYCV
jgi:hypothetical protein